MQFRHAYVETEEHAFDLVVQAFVDGETTGIFREEIDDGGLGAGLFLLERHAFTEFFEGFRGDGLVGVDEVGFRDFVFRTCEGFGET